ncbi:uncharacterized protein si:dkey-261l7.2 [Osmerus eperlanus]|uniref:uncharacterized protein si:dkey-261l7.2 n=1 Tax=Osmerus eperlanus TaxID=29151 RepID=UPI002E14C76E
MPHLTPATILQLSLLLSALPAQYLISRWTGASVAQRYHATRRILAVWNEWSDTYLSADAWTEWLSKILFKFQELLTGEEEPGESPALEVLLHDNDQGYFGASRTVRSPRPPFVFMRVGQVVMENRGKMVGVVVAWDSELRAPQEWINRVYSNSEEVAAKHTPHYKVVFSGPGQSSIMVGYLPQTKLKRITGMKPDIPTLEQYFTHFDGEQFVMQPWLKEIFPED